MRVIVLGPPGSGKSTHARLLADRLSATHVSVGAALRREVAAQSPLGIRVAAKVDAGELADTTDVLEVLKDPLMAATRSGGWVLDGAPRTVAQAAVLDEWLAVLRAPADCVVALGDGAAPTTPPMSSPTGCGSGKRTAAPCWSGTN